SREGSALRVGEITQALTLGTARIDAARARVDAVQVRSHRVGRDEQIAVRERNLEQVQPIDDGRTTVLMLPVREPHGSATEGGDGPAIDGEARRRRSRLKPRVSPAEAVEGPRVPHTAPVQAEAGEEGEDTQAVDGRGRETRRRRLREVARGHRDLGDP